MTYFRCIVTLRNGAHKILRMTRDVMATMVTAFRSAQKSPWLIKRHADLFERFGLTPSQVLCLLFINEYTGEKLVVA